MMPLLPWGTKYGQCISSQIQSSSVKDPCWLALADLFITRTPVTNTFEWKADVQASQEKNKLLQ